MVSLNHQNSTASGGKTYGQIPERLFCGGGATAANQCEGAYNEGGRGLSSVDVVPFGPDRFPVALGQLKMLDCDAEHFYPSHEAIDMYHHFKEDIKLFAEMGFPLLPPVHCLDPHPAQRR